MYTSQFLHRRLQISVLPLHWPGPLRTPPHSLTHSPCHQNSSPKRTATLLPLIGPLLAKRGWVYQTWGWSLPGPLHNKVRMETGVLHSYRTCVIWFPPLVDHSPHLSHPLAPILHVVTRASPMELPTENFRRGVDYARAQSLGMVPLDSVQLVVRPLSIEDHQYWTHYRGLSRFPH